MEIFKQSVDNELAGYESICALSETMMTVAKEGDWERIVDLEKSRRLLIESVRDSGRKNILPRKNSVRKIDLIHRILSADVEVKACVQQRMTSLRNNFEAEKKLLKTYTHYQTA